MSEKTTTSTGASKSNLYKTLIEKIFLDRYADGAVEVPFERSDIEDAASAMGVPLPKNIGDLVYSFRYRAPMPESILATQTEGREWVIEGAGRAKYLFRLAQVSRIVPNPDLVTIKLPDATPEIVSAYSLSDEQALLAKVRYNRLIDVFLGVAAYSLQNHLRTTVSHVGQIEIDEIYVGVDHQGRQYVMPVQAKGGSDRLSIVQTKQDIQCCAERFPHLICRPISTQFMSGDLIALFELTIEQDEVRVVEERHYRLVPSEHITAEELAAYARRL
ncbi:MAG: endonuclease [Gammaproteobacteria bacterium]|nr:endonuclease [Gammaproteobacteria bacterium]MYG11479.1 endonuclease [Gammaproteobacteria bacterium]